MPQPALVWCSALCVERWKCDQHKQTWSRRCRPCGSSFFQSVFPHRTCETSSKKEMYNPLNTGSVCTLYVVFFIYLTCRDNIPTRMKIVKVRQRKYTCPAPIAIQSQRISKKMLWQPFIGSCVALQRAILRMQAYQIRYVSSHVFTCSRAVNMDAGSIELYQKI